ncbi:hypothetical protein L2E82_40538 [Cichorium intybus]|uniref:Uncharacterized protein n=1 Tax=Cichorium intybus TaxID=13427 RepID=A0ACB9ALX1_CICIN|nr:hypothetical protein L2E82_40538 [Cichorium intybus]
MEATVAWAVAEEEVTEFSFYEGNEEEKGVKIDPSFVPPNSDPKMNDTDVSKQIEQMVRFIRQEADEKANEISVSAEEFNIEKLQLVEAEKKKIRQEYERKQKQVEVRRKIEYSMQLNASRIKVLQAQDDLVTAMREKASKDLLNVSHYKSHHLHNYEGLLRALVIQQRPNMQEKNMCIHLTLLLTPSTFHLLLLMMILMLFHGVVLASRDGKIVFENTLDARLDVIFRGKLPEIRRLLFAQVAA